VGNIEAAVVVPESDPSALGQRLAGQKIDAVVNLAAAGVDPSNRDPTALAKTNSLLPASLLVVARALDAKAFIQVGSSAEYAPVTPGVAITEDSALESRRLYGASKAAGSMLALASGCHLNIPVAVLRLFSVFGAGEAPHRLFPSLLSSLLSEHAVLLSPGTQVRDFMHVDDACSAIHAMLRALISRPTVAGIYNLSTGTGTTVAAFARELAAVVGADATLLQFGALPFRADDLPWVVGAPDKLERTIGWRNPRPLAEAMRKAVRDWGETSRMQSA
jgi:nucleoside-diphosphate-sugar epimerase